MSNLKKNCAVLHIFSVKFSLERKSLVKLLAPKPSILILKHAFLTLFRTWALQSEEMTLLKGLGSGHFGAVHLGEWKGQGDVAVKVIKELHVRR